MQDAQQVAEKRRTNLQERKLDKCPRVWTTTLLRSHVAEYDASSEGEAGFDAPDVLWDVPSIGSGGEAGRCPGERCVSALHSLGPLHP